MGGLVLGVLASAGLGPLATNSPMTPVDSPVGWALMAVGARRQFGQAVADETASLSYSPTLTSQSADTVATADQKTFAAMATAAATNSAPVVPAQPVGTPNPVTGVVTGTVNATDPDGNTLSYAVTGVPTSGTVTVNAASGAYTYTPTSAARLAAGSTPGPDTDAFTVAVSDGQTATTAPVSVYVSPTQFADQAPMSVGTTPSGTAFSGNYAYAANQGSNTVSVVDRSTNTVVKTIAVGTAPTGVAVTPTGSQVYVTNSGSGSVSVINTATNTVTTTIAVGAAPTGVAVSPDGTRVYVTNSGINTVSVIDTATNTRHRHHPCRQQSVGGGVQPHRRPGPTSPTAAAARCQSSPPRPAKSLPLGSVPRRKGWRSAPTAAGSTSPTRAATQCR